MATLQLQNGDHPSNDRIASPRCPTPPPLHVIFMKWRRLVASVPESDVGLAKASVVQLQLIYIDNRIQTDAILLDFQKSFDKVPHQRLLYKLKYYGISHHKHSTGYTHSYLTAHSRSSWRAICLPPPTSLLESPKEVFSALSSS